MYYDPRAAGDYQREADIKNAAERSHRSFGGEGDDDEAQGLFSGLDAFSNAQISSRALNGQNAERSYTVKDPIRGN